MYDTNMSVITIQKRKIEEENGVVILPLKEYKKLVESAVPTYHLTEKAAKRLDKLVNEGLKEHKAGKTRTIKSLAELD